MNDVRSFKIPFDVSSEEKILKGMLSFRQMLYMGINLLSIGFLFIPLPIVIRILVFLPVVTFSSLCAFLTIEGVYFDKYTLYFLKYLKKNKRYLYKK